MKYVFSLPYFFTHTLSSAGLFEQHDSGGFFQIQKGNESSISKSLLKLMSYYSSSNMKCSFHLVDFLFLVLGA